MISTQPLTKRTVDAPTPRERPYIVFDGKLPGFGIRVASTGRKTFFLDYRPHGGGRNIAKRRLTFGPYGPLTPEAARKAAAEAIARVRLGQDPQQEKVARRTAGTVSILIDAFIAGHVDTKCKAKTAEAHKVALERLRASHGSLKAEALTRAQVAAMHTGLAGSPFAANRFLAVVSKCFSWGAERGLVPDRHINPATRIERYPEHGRERFLASDELARLAMRSVKAKLLACPMRWTTRSQKRSTRQRLISGGASWTLMR